MLVSSECKVKATDFDANRTGSESQLHHLIAERLWASDLFISSFIHFPNKNVFEHQVPEVVPGTQDSVVSKTWFLSLRSFQSSGGECHVVTGLEQSDKEACRNEDRQLPRESAISAGRREAARVSQVV